MAKKQNLFSETYEESKKETESVSSLKLNSNAIQFICDHQNLICGKTSVVETEVTESYESYSPSEEVCCNVYVQTNKKEMCELNEIEDCEATISYESEDDT